ncbi:DUF4229 domain-containing protein [Cellulomonas sp. H30R-01]|uniref:DUF4229 domain-containing protein n=1 Tax=Cellulomonas sp. H30R-01 TaxID=2704467 RepID=UPI00138C1DF2|nr:DUF4229 domain-containing protein [Cellulomonas sp. H30R-01]QHT56685.1 DUF4229 domain-containing protein [Cellulomonas sp. H30R-01]
MPVVLYTLYRLLLFAAFLGLLWVAGLRSWLAVIAAALLAWMAGYVLLRTPRDAAVAWIAARDERRTREGTKGRSRADQDADVEDAAVDAAREPRSEDEPAPLTSPGGDAPRPTATDDGGTTIDRTAPPA